MGEIEVKEKILTLTNTQAQQERILNELIQSMIDLDVDKLEDILDNHISVRGIERTITQIIFPFMERIGVLWLTNHINPAQEHLVTNIIRQKLLVGIEGVVTSLKINKTVLLFLPEGEFHELGMLFMYYLLKSRGVSVIYLGANVPINDVEYVVKIKKPTYVYTHLTSIGQKFNFDKFIASIVKKLINTQMIVSGQLTHTYEKKIPPQIYFKKSFSEVMEFVSGL